MSRVPLVSVVLATYNAGPELGNAIESVLQQTLEDLELVVVDDGSTNGAPDAIAAWQRRDSRVVLVRQGRNQGLAAALNEGMRVARAPLIARLDDDDTCLSGRLERQLGFLATHPEIDVLGAGAHEVGAHGESVVVLRPERHERLVADAFLRTPFIHPTVVMRRRFVEHMRGYDESLRRAQDWDLWLRGRHQAMYHNLQEPVINYRRRPRLRWGDCVAASRVAWRNASRENIGLPGCWYAVRPLAGYFAQWRRGW